MTENILIRVHDKTLKFVGFITPQMYSNAVWKRYLMDSTSEVSTFEFELYKTDTYITSLLNDKAWISFSRNGRSFLFGTNKVAENESKISFMCEGLNLELINETTPEYKSSGAKTFLELFSAMGLNLSQVEIGINELATYTRSVEFDGTDTKLKRLSSLVNKFDGEMEFVDKLHPDGTLDKIVLNLYKKHSETTQGVGTRRNDLTLFYRKNIQTITRTVDKSGLYTAIIPVGKNGLTVSSINKTEYDDNGNVLFISPQGHRAIMCPSIADEYPSQLSSEIGDKYIKLDWSYETDNINVLYGQALAKLKQIYLPAITYEVTGFFEAEIGDTLKINDDGFDHVLLLEARVTMQEIHFKNPSNNKTIFDNFRALQNKLSQDIQSRLAEMIDQATPYKAVTATTNGMQFKNGAGSTDLIGRVYKGTSEVTPNGYIWKKGDVTLPTTTNTITVSASDVDEKSVYRWSAVINGVTVAFDEVTITDVSDGTDGISPTVTVNPDTSLTIVDAQGTSITPALKGAPGADGTSGIIVSSVAPESPQTGQLWQDTSTTPQLVKKWTGSSWVIWELYAQNLKADTLETISAKIGKIYNEFDNSSGGVDNKGTITIEDSVKVVYYLGDSSTTIDLVTSSSGQGLFTQYLPDKTDASKFKQSWYMPTGLYFTDSINDFTGQITAENVTLSSWQNLILNSGFTVGDGVQPQYRRIKNLDGSYSVQFRGAVSPTSGNFPTSQVQVASLSGNYIPQIHTFVQGSDNTGRGGRVAALSDGRLMILAPNNSSYMYLNTLTYIN